MIYAGRNILSVPFEERTICKFGDNDIDTVEFNITEVLSGNIQYLLYIEFSDGSINSVVLTPKTGSNNILAWKVKANQIFKSGIAFIQLKALSENGEIWHSPKATVEFYDSIDSNPITSEYTPTVFEQIDEKINELYTYTEIYKQELIDKDYISRPEAAEMINNSLENLLLPLNSRLDGEL